MHDTGYVTQNSQDDVDPKLGANADLQEYAQGREQNGNYDTDNIHQRCAFLVDLAGLVIISEHL